jgi:hypothetical protein
MSDDPFAVRNWVVSHLQQAGPGLMPIKVTQVQFNLGNHGPFFLRYQDADFTADRVRSDVSNIVAELTALASHLKA